MSTIFPDTSSLFICKSHTYFHSNFVFLYFKWCLWWIFFSDVLLNEICGTLISPICLLESTYCCCRNAMMSCSGEVIGRMDLSPWSTTNPHFIVSGSLLADSVARAKRDVHKILQQEMDLWEQRML